jgi:hypothetical protein
MPPFSSALSFDVLLRVSAAHPSFKNDVLAFAAGERADRVVLLRHAPRVKALRVVAHLLEREPTLAIETVSVGGIAGCSDFRGVVTVVAGGEQRSWEFLWDCRWRAREAGLLDRWGHPDQARAAREFGWRCFAVWREEPVPLARTGTVG